MDYEKWLNIDMRHRLIFTNKLIGPSLTSTLLFFSESPNFTKRLAGVVILHLVFILFLTPLNRFIFLADCLIRTAKSRRRRRPAYLFGLDYFWRSVCVCVWFCLPFFRENPSPLSYQKAGFQTHRSGATTTQRTTRVRLYHEQKSRN